MTTTNESDLQARGFAIFPIWPNSKSPACPNGCKDAVSSARHYDELLDGRRNMNAGVEAMRSGLVIIDVDNKDGRDASAFFAGREPATLTARTPSGGLHYYFKAPGGDPLPNSKDRIVPGLEVKAQNQYVVAPPSSIDGKAYEWQKDAPVAPLPAWLHSAIVKAVEAKPMPQRPTQAAPTIRLDVLNGSNDVIKRAAAYIAKCPPAVEGQGGDVHTFKLAGTMMGKFGLSEDETYSLMLPWNASCSPPWTDEGLRAKIASAARNGTLPAPAEDRPRLIVDRDELTDVKAAFSTPIAGVVSGAPVNATTGIVWMSDIQERQVSWLWRDRIPYGAITVVSGVGGVNKSTIAYDLAARLSAGRPFPLVNDATRGCTIIVSGEDDPQTVIRPRLRVAGADLTRVGILDIRENVNGEMKKRRFALTDLSHLEAALKAAPDVKMIVIDPVGSFAGKANGDKQFDIMGITSALNEMAAKYNVAIICLQHLNKSSGKGGGLRDRLMGSAGWYDGSRSCFLVTLDKDNPDRRLLSHGKSNHSRVQDAIGFEVVAGEAIRLKWDDATTAGNADDALRETAVTKADAAEWLKERLTRGEAVVNDLKAEAAEVGISYQQLWRAKDKLSIKSRKDGFNDPWKWSLPVNVESDGEDRPF